MNCQMAAGPSDPLGARDRMSACVNRPKRIGITLVPEARGSGNQLPVESMKCCARANRYKATVRAGAAEHDSLPIDRPL